MPEIVIKGLGASANKGGTSAAQNRSAIEGYPIGKPPSMADGQRRTKNMRVKTRKSDVK